MSKIGENIRKITRAWGGETYGSGIGDAIRDLADNLPFGVKTEMVEIVPEQSVTAQRTNAVGYIFESEEKLFGITVGKEYTVVVNSKSYKAECLDDGGAYIEFGRGTSEYFLCANFDGISSYEWAESYGETITLAIYEEQEVVKQIDPKFVGTSSGGAEPDVVFTAHGGVSNLGSFKASNVTASDGITSAIEKIIAGGSITAEIVNPWKYGGVTITDIYKLTSISCSADYVSFTFMFIDTNENRLEEASIICNLDGTINQANVTVIS